MRLSNTSPGGSPVDFRIAEIKTPLVLQAWKEKLARHPDREYAEYILKEIEEGFCTGVDSRRSMTSSRRNMLSAQQLITQYIVKQVANGNILGAFSRETCSSEGPHQPHRGYPQEAPAWEMEDHYGFVLPRGSKCE